jgi:predicted nucleic acid-binding protein
MILVDTNVVSEPLRRVPEPRVAGWLDAQALETLYLSAITVAELRFGVRSLPAGCRRDRLDEDLEGQVLPMFAGRVLSFNLAASQGLCGADGEGAV